MSTRRQRARRVGRVDRAPWCPSCCPHRHFIVPSSALISPSTRISPSARISPHPPSSAHQPSSALISPSSAFHQPIRPHPPIRPQACCTPFASDSSHLTNLTHQAMTHEERCEAALHEIQSLTGATDLAVSPARLTPRASTPAAAAAPHLLAVASAIPLYKPSAMPLCWPAAYARLQPTLVSS